MPRNITVTFDDGSTHVYQNAPDDVTPDAVHDRAQKEFGKAVSSLDGGRGGQGAGGDAPGLLASVAAGAGQRFGNTVLGGQKLLGKGVRAIDEAAGGKSLSSLVTGKPSSVVGRAGQWLIDDAERGQAKLSAENRPYKEANPLANTMGSIASDVVVTAPIGGLIGGAISKAAPMAGSAAPAVNKLAAAVQSGGLSLGGKSAAGVGGKVGDMAIRAAGGAINGGASTALVEPDSAGTGAMLGAAIPVAVRGAGAAGRAVRNSLAVSPEVAKLAARAKELGIDIPADRIANSKPLNALAASLEYVPLSGRAATGERMSKQLNTALSRTVGQESDNVTMALRNAADDLGGKFDEVLKSNNIKASDGFLSKLANVERTANDELVGDAAATINKQIGQIMEKASAGTIDGQAAYNIKRTLDRLGRGAGPEAYHARELRDVIMDGLNESLGKDGAKAFSKVRQQYGNMRALEKLAQNGAEGEISAARLGNMKNIKNKELQELADIAAQFVKTRESPHGALQRLVIGGAATSATAGTAGLAGLPYLAGAAVAGRGANAMLNSTALKNALLRNPQVQQQIGADEINMLTQALARAAPVSLTPSGSR
jgi:hypothetical protein